jgi:hypothetical protein
MPLGGLFSHQMLYFSGNVAMGMKISGNINGMYGRTATNLKASDARLPVASRLS